MTKQAVSERELRARLHQRLTSRPGDRVVYLRAHEGLAYSTVQATMDLIASEDAGVVGLVSMAEAPRRVGR